LFTLAASVGGAETLLAAAAPTARPAAIAVAAATASQDLPPKYTVAKAVDGDDKTHWAVPNTLPQWLRIEFGAPVAVDTLRVLAVDAPTLYDNWRRVTAVFADGSTFGVTLADQTGWHTMTFPARTTAWVKLTIESTYKRTHYVGCEEISAHFLDHRNTEITMDPKPAPVSTSSAADASAWEPGPAERALLARLAPDTTLSATHPNLWVNAADVGRAKRNIRTRRWA
jgi:hypothetical protein